MDSGLSGHFKPFTISIFLKSRAFLVPRSVSELKVEFCNIAGWLTDLRSAMVHTGPLSTTDPSCVLRERSGITSWRLLSIWEGRHTIWRLREDYLSVLQSCCSFFTHVACYCWRWVCLDSPSVAKLILRLLNYDLVFKFLLPVWNNWN